MQREICKSLIKFKGSGYGEINAALRDNIVTSDMIKTYYGKDSVITDIANIDKGLSNDGSIRNVTFYRGISGNYIPTAIKSTSGVLVSKGFSSTTFDLKVAKKFSNGCCILAFRIPDNIKYYVFPEGNDRQHIEREVLIERNIEYVIDMKSSKHPYYVANIRKWIPPIINEEKNKEIIEEIKKDINKIRTHSEWVKYYMDQGESEEEAIWLADMEV